MDFDSPSAAQKAVTALKASGVQAQMAKVRELPHVYSSKEWLAPKSSSRLPEWLKIVKLMGKGYLQRFSTVSGPGSH